jgi:hypothetical protein
MTRAWQRPLTEDTARLEGVSELHHLLVESEATTDTDGLHMITRVVEIGHDPKFLVKR